MINQDELKRQAARHAVEFIQSGMIVGLGTGRTAKYAMERIAKRMKNGQLKNILGIPSSIHTQRFARSLHIPLTTFEEHPEIDVTIDGADEVDPNLNLIKGGGGALLREKVLAQASRRNIIIIDDSKISPQLGSKWAVPIEIISFALPTIVDFLRLLGAAVSLRKNEDGSVYYTDQNNLIIDARFDPIADPEALGAALKQRAGIVEHGLFLGLATDVIAAGENGVRHFRRENGKINIG
jgi:ribose 5-phosphate isomerase A